MFCNFRTSRQPLRHFRQQHQPYQPLPLLTNRKFFSTNLKQLTDLQKNITKSPRKLNQNPNLRNFENPPRLLARSILKSSPKPFLYNQVNEEEADRIAQEKELKYLNKKFRIHITLVLSLIHI